VVGNRPELREVMIRGVRKGRMSPQNVLEKRGWDWVKGAGGGVVGCHKPVDFYYYILLYKLYKLLCEVFKAKFGRVSMGVILEPETYR